MSYASTFSLLNGLKLKLGTNELLNGIGNGTIFKENTILHTPLCNTLIKTLQNKPNKYASSIQTCLHNIIDIFINNKNFKKITYLMITNNY